MTKNQIAKLKEEKRMLSTAINAMLIQALGLEVRNSYVCEQIGEYDEGLECKLKFMNRYVRYSDEASVPINRSNVLFDPINHPKFAQYLFNIFLTKDEKETGKKVFLYFIEYETVPYLLRLRRSVPGSPDLEDTLSNRFHNQNLTYIDIILKTIGIPEIMYMQNLMALDQIYVTEQANGI